MGVLSSFFLLVIYELDTGVIWESRRFLLKELVHFQDRLTKSWHSFSGLVMNATTVEAEGQMKSLQRVSEDPVQSWSMGCQVLLQVSGSCHKKLCLVERDEGLGFGDCNDAQKNCWAWMYPKKGHGWIPRLYR